MIQHHQGLPSMRYRRAQAEKRAAIAAARAATVRRGPRVVEVPPETKHGPLLRALRAMAESHANDGNTRTAHTLTVAALVIEQLQAEIDATRQQSTDGE